MRLRAYRTTCTARRFTAQLLCAHSAATGCSARQICRLRWDLSGELQASMPVVLRISAQDYRMWTYGRELNFSQYKGSAFGRSGYFTSMDGLHWTSVSGMHIIWVNWP